MENEPRMQAAQTIGVLAAILANPKVKLRNLASTFELSEAQVAKLLTIYREAGIDLRYDREQGQYVGKISKSLGNWLLTDVKDKLARSLREDAAAYYGIGEAPSLDSMRDIYTLEEFAEKVLTTTTAGAVYNMALGWNGATMPEGWAAYQMKPRGKWLVTKADYDAKKRCFIFPADLAHPYRQNVGQRPAAAPKPEQCRHVEKGVRCERTDIAADGQCQRHYATARRKRLKKSDAQRHNKKTRAA